MKALELYGSYQIYSRISPEFPTIDATTLRLTEINLWDDLRSTITRTHVRVSLDELGHVGWV